MKRITRTLSLLLAVLTLLSLTGSALAATKPSIEPKTLWAGCEYFSTVNFMNMPESAKITSIKSSNTSVIKVIKDGSGIHDSYLEPLKVGKSKITVKYKYKGKTSTISGTYRVKKYPNPLKSVTVNGKKLDIKNNKYYYDYKKYTGTKTLVKVKPASGWQIYWTWGYSENPKKEGTFKDFTPKSGKTFTLKKGYEGCVFFTLSNGKGEDIQYGIRFYR